MFALFLLLFFFYPTHNKWSMPCSCSSISTKLCLLLHTCKTAIYALSQVIYGLHNRCLYQSRLCFGMNMSSTEKIIYLSARIFGWYLILLVNSAVIVLTWQQFCTRKPLDCPFLATVTILHAEASLVSPFTQTLHGEKGLVRFYSYCWK